MPRARHLRAVLLGVLLTAAVWLLPDALVGKAAGGAVTLAHGRIAAIGALDPQLGTRLAEVEVLEGDRVGERLRADLGPEDPAAGGTTYHADDEVVLQISSTPDGEYAAVSDRWRTPLLGGLLAGFALLVVVVAGWRGIRALLALGLTIGVVIRILLPALIGGWDPVWLAVVAGSAVTLATLLLTEGRSRTTVAAALGTAGALGATAIVAALVTSLARFSVLQGSEEVAFLQSALGVDVDLSGLLLASLILAALGVLDDVTVTQAVTVEELRRSDPSASRATIAGRAMTIGRAHIGATVNTLVLAYVAATLPLLLLFALSPQPAGALASTESVAIEVVRALVGSVGIVLAVPFTTGVALFLAPAAAHPAEPRPGGGPA